MDGSGPTESGRAVPLDLAPSFQVDPSLFPADPVDRIRLVATDVTSAEVVGSADLEVSPTATQWTVSLGITLGEAASRTVLVDVELLAGDVVQWSGRLGPIVVNAGVTLPVQSVDIHRGSLDDLDVLSIELVDPPSSIDVGATAMLVANPTLIAGSTVVPTVYWASTNTAVATVTPQGLVATVTGVSAGTTQIVAAAGSASVELDLEVVAIAPPGFDVEWRGTTTDWHTPANWSTGQVPTATDDVYIPASAVDPTISTDVTIRALTVEAGAVLTLNARLTASGDLDVAGEIQGGWVEWIGGSDTVRGTITATLQVAASSSASGALAVDDLLVTDGVFNVNGQTIDVANELSTVGAGALQMTVAGSRVNTVYAAFAGGGTSGLLTAGELHVRDEFQASSAAQSFVASGTHTVVFDGGQDQFVDFSDPGQFAQRFHNVVFDNPGVVQFLSSAVVTGTLTVLQGSAELSDYELSIGGALVDPDGGLLYAQLRLIGPVTALPSTIVSSVFVDADVEWPVDATVAGDVTIDGSLDVGTHTLEPSGSVYVNGSLDVPTGGVVNAAGMLQLASGSTLHVDGVVTASGGCVNEGAVITGTGDHPCGPPPAGTRTWVGGDQAGSTDWHIANNWSPAGVPGPNDDVVIPADADVNLSAAAEAASLSIGSYATLDQANYPLTVTGDVDTEQASIFAGLLRVTGQGSVLRGSFDGLEIAADRVLSGYVQVASDLFISDAALDVNGWLTSVAGDLQVVGANAYLIMVAPGDYVNVVGDVTFDGADHTNLLSSGALSVGGDFTVTDRSATGFAASGNHALYFTGTAPHTVSFAAPGAGQQRIASLYVNSSGLTTFLTDARVIENASVTGVWEIPTNRTVDIDGTLTLYPGSTLVVDGIVTAAGGCLNYGGQIQGGGTHPCPPPPTADRSWVGGDASGSPTAWDNPLNWAPAGVPASNESVYIPSTTYGPSLTAAQDVAALYVDNGAILDLGGYTLSVGGDVFVGTSAFVDNGLLSMDGQGGQLEGYFDHLRITAPVTLSGYTVAYGDMDVQAPLTIGPQYLIVGGVFDVGTTQGAVIMNDSDGVITVEGAAGFDGASTTGLLNEGILYLTGDFYVSDTYSSDSFAPTGVEVWLAGSSDQTIDFTAPGVGQSFADLWIYKSGGSVILGSDIVVNGTLYTSAATVTKPVGTAPTLRVSGALALTQSTFEVPVRLESTLPPSAHALNTVTFQNMPVAATQLYMALPADGLGALQIQTPVFSTVPAPGAFYLHVANTTQIATLEVQVTNPTPLNQPTQVSTQGVGLVNLIWPYNP